MTAVNLNRAIRGPVTAVPVVAGKGVRLVADTVNNRFVVEADETVLWEDSDGATGFTTTEPIENFERLLIYVTSYHGAAKPTGVIVPMVANNVSGNLIISWTDKYDITNWRILTWCLTLSRSGNVFSTSSNYYMGVSSSGSFSSAVNTVDHRIYKVVGINRVSSTEENFL